MDGSSRDSPQGLSSNQASSPADANTFKLQVEKLEKDIKEAKELLSMPTKVPRREIELNIIDRPFNPDGPSDTDIAIAFDHAYRSGGPAALARALQHTAERYLTSKIDKRANYRCVADSTSRVHIINMLCTQSPRFIEHLINGDLMWQFLNDSDCISDFIEHHDLDKVPGCYVQAHVQKKVIPDATSTDRLNPNRGRWLTGRQIRQFYNTACMYLDPQTQADEEMVKKIEMKFQTSRPFLPGQKYLQGTGREKIKEWLDAWKERWILRIDKLLEEEKRSGVTNDILDKSLKYAPLEIGYGVDVAARAGQHSSHDMSNSIFTFYQAVCHVLFDPEANVFGVIRLMTNRIAHYEKDHAYLDARISDVCQTMLCGAEWFCGGLNPVPGGGAGVNRFILENREPWLKDNFKRIYRDPSLFRDNITRGTKQLDELEEHVRRAKKVAEEEDKHKTMEKDLWVQIGKAEAKLEELQEVAILIEAKQVFERVVADSGTHAQEPAEDNN